MSLLEDKIWLRIATLEDQEEALKYPGCACLFGREIEGADIEKCQEAVCKDPYWAYCFAKYIEGADLIKISKLCPEISDGIDMLIMDRVLV